VIVRTWRALATPVGARSYVAYYHRVVRPALLGFAGHRGSLVLTRAEKQVIEITVLTMWDSFEAISAYAPDPDKAIIDAEAEALLLVFDPAVQHHHVALDTRFERAPTPTPF